MQRVTTVFLPILLVLITVFFRVPMDAAERDTWPQFRGPTMNAVVADNPALPERWSRTENVEWISDLPGIGWSSPIVWENRVFVTTVTAVGNFELPKP